VLSCAVGFLLEFMVFFFILLFFRIPLSPSMLFVILFLFLEFILVFGIGLALSSLYVLFRDYADIWELTLTVLFFLTPIVWPTTIIPKNYLPYILLNPLSQIIITTRSAVLEGTMPSLMSIISSTLLCLLAFIVGYLIFKRIEPKFGREL
jgi:ABC-type polysaccharide/polyol phosphate export permease